MGQHYKINKLYLISLLMVAGSMGLLIWPLAYLFGIALQDRNAWYGDLNYLFQVVGFTSLQALLSAILSGFVGIVFALICYETELPGKKIIIRFSEVTFFLPTLIVSLALVGVWGNRGWLGGLLPENKFYGWFGVLLAHVFLNFSVFFKLVGQTLTNSDRIDEKIALSLGAGRWKAFWGVTFKKLRPAIVQSFVLVYIYCSSSFVILLLLGGGPRFTGLETAIYQAIKVDLNLPLAASLSSIQLLICFVLFFSFNAQTKINTGSKLGYRERIYSCRTRLEKNSIFIISWIVFGILILLPLTQLLVSGFSGVFKLSWGDAGGSILASLSLGLRVAFFSTLMGLSSAYLVRHSHNITFKRWVSFLSLLPIAVSTMVLGVALTLAIPGFREWGQSHLWGVVFVQSISIFPLTFRLISESFSQIAEDVLLTARGLGAKEYKVFTLVELPLIRKGVVSAMVTGLGVSLGEVGALLLFESQTNLTLPLWLFRLMGKYQFNEAYAVGSLLLTLMVLVFFVKERWEHLN